MKKRYRDPEWLKKEYWYKDKTGEEIGEELGISGNAVYQWLDKFGIERGHRFDLNEQSRSEIEGLILGGNISNSNKMSFRGSDDLLDFFEKELESHYLHSRREDTPDEKDSLITLSYPQLKKIKENWWREGKLKIPDDFKLNKLSLLFWYLRKGRIDGNYVWLTVPFQLKNYGCLKEEMARLGIKSDFRDYSGNSNTTYLRIHFEDWGDLFSILKENKKGSTFLPSEKEIKRMVRKRKGLKMKEEKEKVFSLYNAGKKRREISERVDVVDETWMKWLEKRGLDSSFYRRSDKDIELEGRLKNILEGCLLGDGSITQAQNKRASFRYSDNSKEHMIWLRSRLEMEDLQLRLKGREYETKAGEVKTQYYLNSLYYPQLKDLRDIWYSSSGKIFPSSFELNPISAKHWYIGDGGWYGDTRAYLFIYSLSEYIPKILSLFKEVGIEGREASNGIVFSKENLPKFFNYILSEDPTFSTIYNYKFPPVYRRK